MDVRYEFRCWGSDLGAARAALDADWGIEAEEERTETYYLGGSPDFIVKARGGIFDVKERVATSGKLEQWRRVADIAFPLDMDELAPWLEQVFGLTGSLTAGDAEMSEADLGAFLEGQGMRVVPVTKMRHRYRLSTLMAEFTQVQAGGRSAETVAVECVDPSALHSGLRLLNIEDCTNESYVEALPRFFD